MKIMRRATAILFMLTACVLTLAHAVVPHHHHHGAVAEWSVGAECDCAGGDTGGCRHSESPADGHRDGCRMMESVVGAYRWHIDASTAYVPDCLQVMIMGVEPAGVPRLYADGWTRVGSDAGDVPVARGPLRRAAGLRAPPVC